MTDYEVVIGLETHIQLNTKTKIFCACKADSWDDEPNTNICPVCTGLPGVLPVLNKAVVEKGVLLAKAMHSDIRMRSFFDRKNYFYPDLPKGTRSPNMISRWQAAVIWIFPCRKAIPAGLASTNCTWKKMLAKPKTLATCA
jgi:hypothetical protein